MSNPGQSPVSAIFDPEKYLGPSIEIMNSLVRDDGRVSFSGVGKTSPYQGIDFVELYEEGSILAEYAIEQAKGAGQGLDIQQIDALDTLVGNINRAGAMVEIEDPTYIRLANLDGDHRTAVLAVIIDSAASSESSS